MTGRFGGWFLLAVGGLGGLLYGIDFGVIAVSMPYIKALKIYTDAEVSWIVGAVMFGGILASATAGILCDRFGRKKMISSASVLLLIAVPVVCFSGESLAIILAGRVLQGMSAGYMAVVMPMYLAESLPPEIRGRGTGIFQLLLGIGLVSAALAGIIISAIYGAADAAADVVSDEAKAIAWRVNFWWSTIPVAVLFVASLFLKESPVWLKMRGVSRNVGEAGVAAARAEVHMVFVNGAKRIAHRAVVARIEEGHKFAVDRGVVGHAVQIGQRSVWLFQLARKEGAGGGVREGGHGVGGVQRQIALENDMARGQLVVGNVAEDVWHIGVAALANERLVLPIRVAHEIGIKDVHGIVERQHTLPKMRAAKLVHIAAGTHGGDVY